MAGRWRWVADAVAVTTSRRDATTSTVVLGPDGALLVDPAWDPDELAWIADDLARSGVTVAAGFATHSHHDHLLWHPGLGDAPRFASPTTAELAAARHDDLVSDLGPDWPSELADLVGLVHGVDGDVVPWPGRRVELLVHHGHIAGHTALWLPDAEVLLAGDMLSDVELPLLETSTGEQYLAGLELLRPYAERARLLIPGHGTVATTAAAIGRWHADNAYLRALLAGEEPQDARLARAGMREAHRANAAAIGARPLTPDVTGPAVPPRSRPAPPAAALPPRPRTARAGPPRRTPRRAGWTPH
jgi:hydroxyacylglutathione hydrolase